jgi:pectate lyase
MIFTANPRVRTRIRRWLGVVLLLGIALGALPGARPAQAQAQAVDPNGYYKLVNRFTGKVLDVAARSTANGALVQQWSDNGGANQQWRLVATDSGYYTLINRNSGLAMEVANWSTASGAQIQQWAGNGGAWQQWRLVDAGGGLFAVENRNSRLVLDVAGASTADGAKIQQWGYSQSAWQQWRLVAVAPPAETGPIGWAAVAGAGLSGTTGGRGGASVTATSIEQLQNYAKSASPLMITVSGQLKGTVTVAANKTIIGKSGAVLEGSLKIASTQNVIVQNLTVKGYNCTDNAVCRDGADAIGVTGSHHIWFDHLDVSNGSDGNLDITKGSDFVTVSWCKFSYSGTGRDHRFSNLIGSADDDTADRGKLNVTFHHNWWGANVDQRMPRTRFGKIHIFNNLYTSAGNSATVASGIEARLLVENNVFSGVNAPHAVRDGGQLAAAGNIYENTSGDRVTSGSAFAPPYAYQLEATANLATAIRNGAGAR